MVAKIKLSLQMIKIANEKIVQGRRLYNKGGSKFDRWNLSLSILKYFVFLSPRQLAGHFFLFLKKFKQKQSMAHVYYLTEKIIGLS